MKYNTYKIKEIASVYSGTTPNTSNDDYWGGNIKWITPAELIDGHNWYVYDTNKKITDKAFKDSNLRMLEKGTILLTTRAPIGKVAIAGEQMCTNQGFKNIVCNEDYAINEYLYFWLLNKKDYLNSLGRGATFKEISKSIVENIEVPLPPINVQKKIANLLNKSLLLIDKRKAQIEALNQLTQSVFLEMFGDPIRNNKGWLEKRLGDLGEWSSGGTPSRKNKIFYQGSIPWLTSGELNQLYTDTSNEFISLEAINNSSAKLIPIGSLLLGMYDTAALKSTITKVESTCNQAIAYSKLDESYLSTLFIYYCIQLGRDHYKSQQRGVRQKNLNLSMIRNIKIIVPPTDIQRKFETTMLKIESQKQLLQKSLTELENLFNSLMQRAFKGELFND